LDSGFLSNRVLEEIIAHYSTQALEFSGSELTEMVLCAGINLAANNADELKLEHFKESLLEASRKRDETSRVFLNLRDHYST